MVVSISSTFVVDSELKIWGKHNNCNNIHILKTILGKKIPNIHVQCTCVVQNICLFMAFSNNFDILLAKKASEQVPLQKLEIHCFHVEATFTAQF